MAYAIELVRLSCDWQRNYQRDNSGTATNYRRLLQLRFPHIDAEMGTIRIGVKALASRNPLSRIFWRG